MCADAPTVNHVQGGRGEREHRWHAGQAEIKTEGNTVKAEGGFAGGPVELSYSPAELTVYIHDCTYRLKNNSEGTYVGRRSCDRSYQRDTEVGSPRSSSSSAPRSRPPCCCCR